MRPSLHAILDKAVDRSVRLVDLIGRDKASQRLGLPGSVVEAALADALSRRRVTRALARHFGFSLDPPDPDLHLLPPAVALDEALHRFALAVALSSHPAVFRRDDYRQLAEAWGDETLAFALRHRPRPADRAATVPHPPNRDEVVAAARTLMPNALKEAHPAVAAVLAVVYDVDLASAEPAEAGLGFGPVAVAALQAAGSRPEPALPSDDITGPP